MIITIFIYFINNTKTLIKKNIIFVISSLHLYIVHYLNYFLERNSQFGPLPYKIVLCKFYRPQVMEVMTLNSTELEVIRKALMHIWVLRRTSGIYSGVIPQEKWPAFVQ